MRTKITDACEKEIKKIMSDVIENQDFRNFKFEFESTFRNSQVEWRSVALSQALNIIERREFFDDYDDWDFTFTYAFEESDYEHTKVLTSVTVTALVR